MLITQIKKRDGEIVNYDSQKIINAFMSAAKDIGEDIDNDLVVLDSVEDKLDEEEGVVVVECIQDNGEDALLEFGHFDTAKAYIQNRERQRHERKSDLFD